MSHVVFGNKVAAKKDAMSNPYIQNVPPANWYTMINATFWIAAQAKMKCNKSYGYLIQN